LLYRFSYPFTYFLVIFGLVIFLMQPYYWNMILPAEFWYRQGIIFSAWLGLFAVNLKYLVPRLLFTNKISWFVLAIILSVVFVHLLEYMISNMMNMSELMQKARHSAGNFAQHHTKKSSFSPLILLITLYIMGTSTTIKVVQKWQKDNDLRQSLEKQNISTELSLLKAQINPHFFFNSLNSIYALTHIDVEKSREALLTLSRMMRYVIYETQSGFTFLSKEVEFLEDYVNLMKLRLTDNVSVKLEVGTYKDMQIASMLFLPYVENAFKHGVSGIHPSQIFISLQQVGMVVELKVINTLLSEKRVVMEESSGIGLANTQRRLELLYPNKYNLQILEDPEKKEYNLELKINLA
jgi:two-component system, LytTR family, sensor kinase